MIRKLLISAALLAATCAAQAAPILTESFDNIGTLGGSGWVTANNSTAGGTISWFQGVPASSFGAHSGAATSYIAANFESAGFGGDVSNWLITPTLSLSNRTSLTFWTRSNGIATDTLEVRLSTNGVSSNVGGTTSSVGDFTTLLASISPTTAPTFTLNWTAFTLNLSGIADGTLGRLAFRYLVSDTSINGDYLGIDSVSVNVPEPSTIALFGIALLGLGLTSRRRSVRLHQDN